MPLTFPNSVGLVVTPSRTPQSWTVRISSMSAVSRKSFMGQAPLGAWWVGDAAILGEVPHPDVSARLSDVEGSLLFRRGACETGGLVGATRGAARGGDPQPDCFE